MSVSWPVSVPGRVDTEVYEGVGMSLPEGWSEMNPLSESLHFGERGPTCRSVPRPVLSEDSNN